YRLTGAFVDALGLGVRFGVIIAKFYKKLVPKMAPIQFGTELYNKITKKFFIKMAGWIILGKNISKVNWVDMQNLKF
ncbi:TIGR03546 family protein, partial [Francisella tularensis subsp. holarctica]|nr:TIGR03546 family protein [Francisella tularensis subsp. holarctica]